MILTSTTDKLSLITDSSCDVDVVASYIDRNQSTGAVGQAERSLTTISTETTTDIVAAPASGITRKILRLSIRNAHASAPVGVTVQFNDNGTLYELHGERLYTGETLQWDEETGFSVGNRVPFLHEMAVQIGPDTWSAVNDQGGGFIMGGHYELTINVPICRKRTRTFGAILAAVTLANAATTTGTHFGVRLSNGPATPSINVCQGIGNATNSVTAATMMAPSTTGSESNLNYIAGTNTLSVNFAFIAACQKEAELSSFIKRIVAHFASEVAGSGVRVKAGSWLNVFEHTG